jgi:hypothetical protein
LLSRMSGGQIEDSEWQTKLAVYSRGISLAEIYRLAEA